VYLVETGLVSRMIPDGIFASGVVRSKRDSRKRKGLLVEPLGCDLG
jgi:hypothetical protein